jgi:hypothetical protein
MRNARSTRFAGLFGCLCSAALAAPVLASPEGCTSYMVNTATGARRCFTTGADPVVQRVYTRAADDAGAAGSLALGLPAAPVLDANTPFARTVLPQASVPGRDGLVPGVTYRIRNYRQPNGDVIQTRQRAGSAEVRTYHYGR